MSCVGAYECETCGGLRYTCEGSKDPIFAPYAKPHICKQKDEPLEEEDD